MQLRKLKCRKGVKDDEDGKARKKIEILILSMVMMKATVRRAGGNEQIERRIGGGNSSDERELERNPWRGDNSTEIGGGENPSRRRLDRAYQRGRSREGENNENTC